MKQIALIAFSLLVFSASISAHAADVQSQTLPSGPVASVTSGQVKPIQAELQPWQRRRMEFTKTVQGASKGDPIARKDFDKILTDFETHTFSRTPLENMEILGVFYVPKDGIEKAMPIVIANAVLGWYDALRFASESGRAEIINNEGFFKKAFVLGGPELANNAVQFLQNNPEKVAKSLTLGFSFADKFRDEASYDRHWPTAYGLEQMTCATGGLCQAAPPMPKDQWNKAWEEAKQRVASYYQLGKPTAVTNPSQSTLGGALVPPFHLGESLPQFMSQMGNAASVGAVINPHTASAGYEVTMIEFPGRGIRLFFRNDNHLLETIRLDAPYSEKVSGIGIGDSLAKLLDKLGNPIRPAWPFVNGSMVYLYKDGVYITRYDVKDDTVANILMLAK